MSANNENGTYTPRQLQSSFQPLIAVSSLPLNVDEVPSSAPTEQQEVAPVVDASQAPLRIEAQSFVPSTNSGNPTSSSLIYDLKKYKYDYFLSTLSCSFDRENSKFGSPSGICALNDDRLLLANFDRDSVFLLDIQGTVYQIYRNLLSPKDVLSHPLNPSQAVVATKKEVVILDLETSQIVARSKLRGFYPWNIQYIQQYDIFAACDPSGERIVYLDKNLNEFGGWSFSDQAPGQFEGYKKKYPYTAHFLSDNTSLVLTHIENKCQLMEYDTPSVAPKKSFQIPPDLKSYSIYVDSERKCLITDIANHRLVSVNPDSTFEEYRWPSVREPYSVTFLSTGTLCIAVRNQSAGTNGGIAVLSETDLKTSA